MEITFCKNRCCPTVVVTNDGKVVLGDEQGSEGITIWTKQNFYDFLVAAKAGKFDNIVADLIKVNETKLCSCGTTTKEACLVYCFQKCQCGSQKENCQRCNTPV